MRFVTVGLIAIVALVLLAVSVAAEAQPVHPQRRVGYLGQNSPSAPAMPSNLRAFREALGSLGWVESQNLVIEYRWAEARPECLSSLAAELTRLKLDVIVCAGPAGLRALKSATETVPSVAIDLETDPVASGDVATLGRPGGGQCHRDISGSGRTQWEMARVISGCRAKTVADSGLLGCGKPVTSAEGNPGRRPHGGDQLQPIEIQNVDALEAAFAMAKTAGAQGLVVLSSPRFGASGAVLGKSRTPESPTSNLSV